MIVRSEEYRQKQRVAQTGKKRTEETKRKIREARARQVITEEHKRNIGDAVKGEKNGFFGKHHSEESLKKMSQSHKGSIVSEETRKKMSLIRKGRKFSEEHRINLSNSHKELVARGVHPSWKGGITPVNAAIRTSIGYRLWREAVFSRDDYTCKFCGQKGGKLVVDHIKPFAYFPDLRLQLSNGRTLCRECHRKTDTFAGKSFKYAKS